MTEEEPLRLSSYSNRRNLRDQVADALRTAVLTGQLESGRIYSAPALAAQFGVSATPVREAMLDLVNHGLVEVVRNKGFQVTAVSEDELDQIVEIRRFLEPPAAAVAARRATAADVAKLRALAQAAVDSASADDLSGFLEADRAFHARLLRLTGNPRLAALVGELRARTQQHAPSEPARRALLNDSAAEHLAICDRLAAGDAAALEKLLRRHIGHRRRESADLSTVDS